MRAHGSAWLFALSLLWNATPIAAKAPPTAPQCSSPVAICIGLVVHVVHESHEAVIPTGWLQPRVAHANRLFVPIGVEFVVLKTQPEEARFADLRTRSQRDALGRGKATRGAIDLFVVRRLADVDIPGAIIRGVHWRDRLKSEERWVILSSIAPELVLAHELGHFFGLPHSADGRSLMNKQKGGGRPPWPSRTFLRSEHRSMMIRRDQMLGTGRLRAQVPRPLLSQ